MESGYIEDGVRTRLILAGINELEEHGVKDFSLRRAASAAQVSCAAPYRHFKDKDEFITEIIKYIGSRRELLAREILSAYSNDPQRLALELSMANLRFWLANPNFRSVLMLPVGDVGGAGEELKKLDSSLNSAILNWCESAGIPEKAEIKKYTVRALIYGTVMLVGSGELENTPRTMDMIRRKLKEEFSNI